MSLFNMSAALRQLSTATVTVRRPNAVGYSAAGTPNTATFTVYTGVRTSFQNMRGDELRHVPEGERTTSWQKVWPAMALQVNDRIVHPTKGTYIVQDLDENMDQGGFSAAYARKLGDGES